MKRGLLAVGLLLSSCAHQAPAVAPTGPRWLDLASLRPTDLVCASGAVGAPCATVADVAIFLHTAKAEEMTDER